MSFLSALITLFKCIISTILWLPCQVLNLVLDYTMHSSSKLRKDEANAQSTINADEIKLFSQIDWWDLNGKMLILHRFNEVRVPFIRDRLIETNPTVSSDKPLKGLKILDVGCGGGILSEPLAKFGADVTGIDPCKELIEIAEEHKLLDPSIADNKPKYILTTAEEHIEKNKELYDIVIASEVLDHINNPRLFVKCCVKALKPGGRIFFTVPNRTWVAQIFFIFLTEYVFNLIPRGTHHIENFVTTADLTSMMEENNCRVEATQGFVLNYLTYKWHSVKPLHFIYGLQAIKNK